MRINTNVSAMNTYGRLTNANAAKSGSLAKLSSGLRINKAGDDAAGLSISEKMKSQIGGLKQATRNAQDGISLIQTAEGALNETHAILGRMRDLATQGANGTLSNDDREALNKEFGELADEITRIAETTEFNTKTLLDKDQGFTFQIGANGGQRMEVKVGNMDADTLGVAGVKLADTDNSEAVTNLKEAYETLVNSTEYKDAVKDNKEAEKAFNTAKKENELAEKAFTTIDNTKTQLGVSLTSAEGNTATFLATGNSTGATLNPDDIDTWANEADKTAYKNLKDIEDGIQGDIDALEPEHTAASVKYKGDALTDPDNPILGTKDIFEAADKVYNGDTATNVVGTKAALAALDAQVSQAKTAYTEAQVELETAGRESADAAIASIDKAIAQVSAQRSDLGAAQNRLGHTIKNLTTTQENLTEANSRIRDVDMAEEMMEFTKNNILSQAATSMLSQANAMPNSVLGLLQ